MGTFRETLAEGTEGALHLGLERPRVYSDLSPEDKERYNADIWATNILLQGLPKDIYSLINHYTDAKDIWDNVKILLEGSELTKEDCELQLMQLNSKFVNNMLPKWGRFVTAVKLNRCLRDSNYDQLYAYLKQHENQATVQEGRVVVQNVQGRQNRGQGNNALGAGAAGYGGAQNRVGNANPSQARQNEVALDEEQLLFIAGGQDNVIDEDVDEQPVQDLELNVDKVFQVDDCNAFDSDVDEAPTVQTMFMANLSSAYPVYDKAGPSYYSDILSEVHDYDHYQDAICEHHEEHEMHDDYVKDNAVPVVQSNVSSISNDAYMMIFNDIHEPHAQSVFDTTRNTVVDNSLTVELKTYKEQVKLYEIRARFELTKREQKIDEQLRIVITDRNIKEENLKKELHSVKMQLASTINHNKSMVEEVTSLKNDFKQKENKYLEEFLDMKALKKRSRINYTNKTNLIKIKEEALKKQTTDSRPIKALMVYPPNIPAMLVPRVLPIKSQVKINIFALIQLFSEFEKTCKKRITPTGFTKGERGFEQTKECYLTEVIPFFKTPKEHFEGIQKALTKEIKEMKDIFEELEAEVDQNVVNRKHDQIEWKNLLIANDNLIVDCFHIIVQTRCLELEAELSKLQDKVQKDDHTELVKRFSNLEVNHLNLQLKYQNLKEIFRNDPSPPARDTPDFDSVFVIEKMKASIQGKDNAIKKLRMQISQLKETRSEADRTLDFKTLDFQITQLTKKVTVLQEQNELFRAENEKVKQHYKELYDSIMITHAKHIEQTMALLTENENLKAQIHENLKCNTIASIKPIVFAPCRYAIDVEPIHPHNKNNREVHLHYLKHLKESVETLHEIVEEAKVERPLDGSLASASLYTKHS
ncbi:hypothetical protein Tco_0517105 [Tanacetum coccineum]